MPPATSRAGLTGDVARRSVSLFLWIGLVQPQNTLAKVMKRYAVNSREPMRRYFFDIVGQQRRAYDYCGREFPTPQNAYQLAELIALDYSIDEKDEWVGCINVRSAEGQEFFSVLVQSSWRAAA